MVNIIVQLVLKFKSNLDFFVTFSKQSEHFSLILCLYFQGGMSSADKEVLL